jgi:drug/metabolite transporter (DMT)-like permease
MSLPVLCLVLASVSLSALAQLLLKLGMTSVRAYALGKEGPQLLWLAVQQPWVLLGLALYGLGALLWLLVLSRLELGVAYPFVALGFLLTMLLGILVLGEQVSSLRVTGTLLIIAGVALVSRTA